MKKRSDIRAYNILLPIWIILFIPSYLWLLLIPANYLIDRIVLKWSLRKADVNVTTDPQLSAGSGGSPQFNSGLFCREHTWKICIAGFISDLAGAFLLLVALTLSSEINNDLLDKISYGLAANPFSNIISFLIISTSVILAAVLIWLLDTSILLKAGLSPEQAKKSALRLAIITAPYLYFLPTEVMYI